MIQLLLVGAAAWMAYEVVRAVVPIPAPIQPLLVVAACYGLTRVPPEVLAALDAAAVAAFIRAAATWLIRPEPIMASRKALRQMLASSKPGRVSRIPDLP
ncbi:hypothetical protein [Microbispora sp. NPDC049633]|uniref:hypothetical protein n=1 Tax=Microbispora sp. NPDC049633 TaxID=3154355 RepID=UPI0034136D69